MINLENKKQFAVLILAIGSGLVSATLVGNYIQKRMEQERREIVKSTKKLIEPVFQQMDAMNAKIQELDQRQAALAQMANSLQQGQKAAPGTPAEAAMPKSSLSLRTPAGKRAYTVLIDSLSAVGGMINPGDYVDILADMNIPSPTSGQVESVTSVVFQNIQILAVNTNLQSPGDYGSQQSARALNITFAFSPQEAGLMTFLQKNGKLQLILRAPAETEVQPMEISAWSTLADYVYEKQGTELLTKPQIKAEKGQEEVKPFIQIFQGGREM